MDSQDTLLAPLTLELTGAQYTALIEVPIETISRDDREFSIVGGQPRVVDDIARAPGASTTDFIDRTVERSERERRATGPALVAAAFENWAIASA